MGLVKPIPSAKFNERLIIKQEVITQDSDTGSTVITLRDVATVWAMIEPMGMAAQYWSQQLRAAVDTKITIHYRTGVIPGMVLVSEEHVYKLEKPARNVNHANVYLEMQCLEQPATGEPS